MPPAVYGLDGARLRWIEGKSAIRQYLPTLQARAVAWNQDEAAAEAAHHIALSTRPERHAILLLFENETGVSSETLLGAVLLFAYAPRLMGRRFLTNGDRLGRIGVFGSEAHRFPIAVFAVRAFMRRGAYAVRLDFETAGEKGVEALQLRQAAPAPAIAGHLQLLQSVNRDSLCTLRLVAKPYDFPLFASLDTTLERFGKRTRRNMRLAMRRCADELGCTLSFRTDVSAEELQRANLHSRVPATRRTVAWRHATSRQPPGFLASLVTARGERLAFAIGRCGPRTVVIDWQASVPVPPQFSLSLAMRGYLMEHFGTLGLQRMYLEGGTSHVMANHFDTRNICQVRVSRRLPLLQWMQRWIARRNPSSHFLKTFFGAAWQQHAGAATRFERTMPTPSAEVQTSGHLTAGHAAAEHIITGDAAAPLDLESHGRAAATNGRGIAGGTQ